MFHHCWPSGTGVACRLETQAGSTDNLGAFNSLNLSMSVWLFYLAHTYRSIKPDQPIKQSIPSQLAVGQIYPAVLTSLTPAGSGWHAQLECGVNAIVPRPYGSNGPVQGDAVIVRLLGINQATGAVVGTLVQGKTISSIR